MTEEKTEEKMFAVLGPDGSLAWHGKDAEKAVHELVGGTQSVDVVLSRSMGRACPLRLIASDVSALYPAEFAANSLAERVLTTLSDGHVCQQWRGHIALFQPDENGYAEAIPPEWVQKIEQTAS